VYIIEDSARAYAESNGRMFRGYASDNSQRTQAQHSPSQIIRIKNANSIGRLKIHLSIQSYLTDFFQPHCCWPTPDDVFTNGRLAWVQLNNHKVAIQRQECQIRYLRVNGKQSTMTLNVRHECPPGQVLGLEDFRWQAPWPWPWPCNRPIVIYSASSCPAETKHFG